MWQIHPWLALGVVASTAATDAVYVMFNAAVSSRKRVPAASWSSVWYLLSAFAVISYTRNWVYVCFAALGSWIGAYLSMTCSASREVIPEIPTTVARKRPRKVGPFAFVPIRCLLECSDVHPALTADG